MDGSPLVPLHKGADFRRIGDGYAFPSHRVQRNILKSIGCYSITLKFTYQPKVFSLVLWLLTADGLVDQLITAGTSIIGWNMTYHRPGAACSYAHSDCLAL